VKSSILHWSVAGIPVWGARCHILRLRGDDGIRDVVGSQFVPQAGTSSCCFSRASSRIVLLTKKLRDWIPRTCAIITFGNIQNLVVVPVCGSQSRNGCDREPKKATQRSWSSPPRPCLFLRTRDLDLECLPITAGKIRMEQRTGSQLLWQVAANFGVTRLEGQLQNHRQSWRPSEDEPVMSIQAT
jgi:hypothetical protein